MTIQEAKEELYRYIDIDENIRIRVSEYGDIEQNIRDLYYPSSSKTSGMPHSGVNDGTVTKYIELNSPEIKAVIDGYEADKTRLSREIKELYEQKQIIRRKIDRLRDNYFKVIYYRFMEGLTLEETADAMHYSCRHIINIYNEALEEFSKL
jgi:DNA-directed RNA polymerase specialized sigma subunit